MPMLMLRTFVVILAVLTTIHIAGEWVARRKRQKRTDALKGWIYRQNEPPTEIYPEAQIRLTHQQEAD